MARLRHLRLKCIYICISKSAVQYMKHFIYHFTNVDSRTKVLANQIHWKSYKREKNNNPRFLV